MQFKFPPPGGYKELEELTCAIIGTPRLAKPPQSYGRPGQKQDGVDVLATERDAAGDDIHVGYQCKNVKELSIDDVINECEKAKSCPVKISRFVVVTTLPRDVALQSAVENIPSGAYDFTVSVWFWDDINEKLNRSAGVAFEHYNRIARLAQPEAARTHAGALRRALDRPAFRDRIEDERNVGDMIEAIAATLAFLRTGFLYNSHGDLVESMLPYQAIEEPRYRAFCGKFEWDLAKLYDHTLTNRAALDNATAASGSAALAVTDYRHKRAQLINSANKQLAKFGMQELNVPTI